MSADGPRTGWRERLRIIIFEADTPGGKAFDVALIVCILLSVLAVTLDSVEAIRARHGVLLLALEWAFTILFTVEYALRLVSARQPLRYARSFFGLVDILAILPTYLSLFFAGSQYLLVVRILRVLRVFRVLKIVQYVGEAQLLVRALRASRRKITIFLSFVMTVVVVIGAVMYLIEGADSGFTSIPRGIYWAIVTLTTVGYGDIAPQTPAGQALAALIMILGYGILAVPTGIVTLELAEAARVGGAAARSCPACRAQGHDVDARHCKHCGARLG